MIPADVRIFLCTEPVDMRRSFDGLALAARERLGQDPWQGGLFAFVNRRANRLNLLWFDRNGYCDSPTQYPESIPPEALLPVAPAVR
jgi:transposase